jgi:hypothetical protein
MLDPFTIHIGGQGGLEQSYQLSVVSFQWSVFSFRYRQPARFGGARVKFWTGTDDILSGLEERVAKGLTEN